MSLPAGVHKKVLEKLGEVPKKRAKGLSSLVKKQQELLTRLESIKSQIKQTCTHADEDLVYKEVHGTSPYHCRTYTHHHVAICKVCGKEFSHYFED